LFALVCLGHQAV